MQEIKKTFITGFSILIILLLAPYYLAWIGYDDGSASSQNTELYKAAAEPIISPPIKDEQPPAFANNSKDIFRPDSAYEKITVEAPLYSADFSSFGGGSFERYELSFEFFILVDIPAAIIIKGILFIRNSWSITYISNKGIFNTIFF